MKLNTDSYIEMGASHNICEDYAINGSFGSEFHYIIVCDGCSSSKDTDFGARILAHACQRELLNAYHASILFGLEWEECKEYLKNKIIHNAMNVVKNFGLSYQICDATLMYAFIFQGRVYYQSYGDGNIMIKRKDNNLNWANLSYKSNAPFYLSYEMDVLRKHSYLEDKDFGGQPFFIKDIEFSDSGEFELNTKELTPNINYGNSLDINNVQFITLSTDGMETYSHTHKRLTEYPSEEEKTSLTVPAIMNRMTNYKNYNGEFVKRRMKRLKGECEKIGAEHFDDVSCATIWVDHGQ